MPPGLGVPVESGHPQALPIILAEKDLPMTRALLPGIAAGLGFGTSLGTLWLNPGLTLFLAGFSLVLGAFQRLVPLLWLSAFFLGPALPQSRAPWEGLLRRGIHGPRKIALAFFHASRKSQALLNAIFWEAGAFFRRGLVHFGASPRSQSLAPYHSHSPGGRLCPYRRPAGVTFARRPDVWNPWNLLDSAGAGLGG